MTLDELESAGRMIRHQMGVDARLQQLQQQGGWQASQGMRPDAPAYRTGPPGAPGGGYPYNGGGGGGMRATAPAYGAPGGYNGGMRANAPAYGAGGGYNQGYGALVVALPLPSLRVGSQVWGRCDAEWAQA